MKQSNTELLNPGFGCHGRVLDAVEAAGSKGIAKASCGEGGIDSKLAFAIFFAAHAASGILPSSIVEPQESCKVVSNLPYTEVHTYNPGLRSLHPFQQLGPKVRRDSPVIVQPWL